VTSEKLTASISGHNPEISVRNRGVAFYFLLKKSAKADFFRDYRVVAPIPSPIAFYHPSEFLKESL